MAGRNRSSRESVPMSTILVLLLLGAGIATAVLLPGQARRRSRARHFATPLSAADRAIVAAEVPLTRRLPPALRPAFEGRITAFLHQVTFLGGGGLEVTDEMRLSIAAQACLLIVNTDTWYDNLRTIIVYPAAFTSRRAEHSGYVVTERDTTRLGESWERGPVVLSWTHSRAGALDAGDGHNVVLHEFAHQIDALTGRANGVPPFAPGQDFAAWERAFLTAYESHLANLRAGRPTVFDPYGATAHAEFFAVAVELFFERPAALRDDAPEVYRQLSLLFALDPVNWPG